MHEKKVSRAHLFSSPARKRGQFYLMITIIIVAMIAGFATITNFSVQKKEPIKISQYGEELGIEGEHVIDYSANAGADVQTELGNLAQDYSQNSGLDNLYFIFGDTSSIIIAGYKKNDAGSISIEGISGGNNSLSLSKGTYNSQSYTVSDTNINITVDGTKYPFALNTGENFYFVISREYEGGLYVYANN